MSPEMTNALGAVCAGIDKKFGKGAVMRLTDRPVADPNNTISTGSIGLDIALGIGGYRKGRIIEIYGPESSGKTTLTLHAIAEAQRRGGVCAFIDAEHALDPKYAERLGVNPENLLINQPDCGEEALEIVNMLARSGEIDLIAVDSVAALVPRKELEGEAGDQHVGLQARMMSQAMRMITGTVHQTNCTVIFINQIRMKIGVMFGSPETTTGGNALKFYASQRLDIRRTNSIKAGEKIIGNRTKVKVVKNKLAPPFKEAEFDIRFGVGIDQFAEIADLGVEDGIIKKSGAWYAYGDQKIGQGRENTIQFLKKNPTACAEIKKQIVDLRGLGEIEPIETKIRESEDSPEESDE